jgi:hypothetical protein
MVLFFADVLGMKARWKTGQISTVRAAYQDFERFVEGALVASRPSGSFSGGLQSDSVALVFDEALDAVRFGMALFLLAFESGTENGRFWLRGLITPTEAGGVGLMSERPLSADSPTVAVRHFSSELLDAVNVEQAFRGPRLLIAESVIDQALKDSLAVSVGGMNVIPLKKLGYTPAPTASGPWWDVLYLLPKPLNQNAVHRRAREMGYRMRWAASGTHCGTDEELAHVAVLAVAWAECEAIAWSVGLRAGVFRW